MAGRDFSANIGLSASRTAFSTIVSSAETTSMLPVRQILYLICPATKPWPPLACACQNATCIRLMSVPVRNPIRISSGVCAGCTFNNREELKMRPGPMRV
jgi:hypothetical protein